jgi:hypothetical protein
VTTGTQTIAGYKIFTGTIGANVDIQLATQGTALNTFLKNINAAGQTSIGSNGFGFNNSNNIYFSGSSKGGGIFAFNNTGNQTYTLQDASGTLAFTSQIPSGIVTDGGVGTADRVPKFTGPGLLTNSAISDATNEVNITKRIVSTISGQQIVITPNLGGSSNRIETTNLPLELVTTGSAIRLAAGGATPQITLNSNGTTDFVTSTSSFATMNSTDANGGVLSFRRNGTNVGHIGNSAQLGAGVLDAIEVRSGTGSSVILKTDGGQLTLATGGGVTLTGALNGTSASFNTTNAITLTASDSRIRGGDTTGRLLLANSGTTTYGIFHGSSHATLPNAIQFYNDNTLSLTLASTGAATFSSSVTAATESTITGTSVNSRLLVTAAGVANTVIGFNNSGATTTGVTNNTGYVGILQAYPLVFTTDSAERMRITSTGNVGIGTASPAQKLEVIGIGSFNNDTSSRKWLINASGGVIQHNLNGNVETQIAFNGGTTYFLGQNVGIGTASPSSKLTVSNAANGTIASFTNTADADFFINLTSGVTLLSPTTGTLAFGTSSTERMRLTSDGDLIFKGGSSSKIHLYKAYSGDPAAVGLAVFNTAGTTVASINGNGGGIYTASLGTGLVYSNGGTLTSTNPSDERLKDNIEGIAWGLEQILKLRPVSYTWKNDTINQGTQFGFIAQEVQEVMPEAVKEFGEEEQYLGLEKEAIYVTLVKAIQELKTEIDSLKNQMK